ncbi:hypothetical protein [Streptomyces sp. NBC_01197]|uniref:hypothetical protein n=1 Tax=Streptomyces sp. NBC_01197 TaxID=2903768 RepID=UPI002E118081|nr:hypothetical protein OG452_05265 [Streptomyces sp. NBC_01197]
MSQVVNPSEARRDRAVTLLENAPVDHCETWVESGGMLITKVHTKTIGCYYAMTLTDLMDEDDKLELKRLEEELGGSINYLTVEIDSYNGPHRQFPGSTSFIYTTVYGGPVEY